MSVPGSIPLNLADTNSTLVSVTLLPYMMRYLLYLLAGLALVSCQSDRGSDLSTSDLTTDTLSVALTVQQEESPGTSLTSDGMSSGSAKATPTHHASRPCDVESLPGIDIALNQRITGPRGETILIPANSLIDANGVIVHGKVQVTWNAALTMAELYAMKAPTVSDGQLLGSGGSVYVEAEQDGQLLRIREGMDWKVTIPSEPVTLFPKATMKVFSGVRKRDEVQWSLNPLERIETVPLTYKYFIMDQGDLLGRDDFERIDSLARRYPARENNTVMAPTADLAIGRDKAHIARTVLPFYTDPRYRQTYVCSLPFLARLRVLTEHIFGLVRTVGDVQYIDERAGANRYIIDILTLYRDHAGEPMRVPDRMAHDLLKQLDVIDPNTPSTSAIHIRKLREAYAEFIAQDLGQPIVIDDRGVDLEASDAFDRLVRTGLSLEAASRTLEEASDRRACIEGLKLRDIVEPAVDGTITEEWTQKLPDGRRAVVRKRQTYSVRYSGGFGYINCDRFIGPEFAQPIDLFVTVDGPELSYERVSIFFPSLNGYMELSRDADARVYRLPPNIKRLPRGQPMALLVVGKSADGYAYQLQEGTITDRVSMRLSPRNGTMEALMDRLAEI